MGILRPDPVQAPPQRKVAHPPPRPAPAGQPGVRDVAAVRGGGALAQVQRVAGNRAAAMFVQRYELREHQAHHPPDPYTTIHFRFDHEALPAYPHEHLHITVQDDEDMARPKAHYYYDSWTGAWRLRGPAVLGADLGAIQQAAITWAEGHAASYGTQFRPPQVAPPPQTFNLQDDFPALGSPSRAQLEKASAAKARKEKAAELKRRKAAEVKAAQELKLAKNKAERERKALAKKEQDATIESLALMFELAFDLSAVQALARARALVLSHAHAPPMSEDALAMYG